MNEEIGSRVRKLRKKNNDTLHSMADKIGYDWSNLSKVERGIYGASVELLRKICEAYNVEPTYFFGEGFTEEEGQVLLEENLDKNNLKEKYNFVVDGIEATDEEIMEAVRLIRYLRPKED